MTESTTVRKTRLDNGLRVVTERMDTVRSVAVGIWFETGSRDETRRINGISHFLEHMVFKGTKKRSALRIAREIEQVGGYLNAFTSKEMTAFYAHLLDEHLPLAVDVLADMLSNSQFRDAWIAKEKNVILEEIANAEDTPEDVVHDDFLGLLFPHHSLGRPVLGTRKTVSSFTRETLIEYWAHHYSPSRCVVAAAGRVDHDQLVRLIEKRLALPEGKPRRRGKATAKTDGRENRRKRDIQQAHICLGCRGFRYMDERKYPLFVMNTVLGAGMSSRLFQRVRERNGLAYSVYSFHESFADTGVFGIYAGTEESQIPRAEELIREELDRIASTPLKPVELKRAKDQLKGSVTLGLESSSSRMHRLARMEMYLGDYLTLDELLARIDSVSTEQVQQVAADLFRGDLYTAYVLPSAGRTS